MGRVTRRLFTLCILFAGWSIHSTAFAEIPTGAACEVVTALGTPGPGSRANQPLLEGNKPIVMGFEGSPPTALIYDKSMIQRKISTSANDTVAAEEKDPALRAKMHTGPGLLVTIEGLVFTPSAKDPSAIELNVIGPTKEVPIMATISRADLEAGKEISIVFPTCGRSFVVGKAVGKGHLKFRYDKPSGTIQIAEFGSSFSVSAFGIPNTDSAVMKDLTLVPKNVARLPLLDKKYITDWAKTARDPWSSP